MRLRPEAGAGIEKSGRGSRAQNQIQKIIFPPELSPNNWLPVQHFIYLEWPTKAIEAEVVLRAEVGVEEGELGGRRRTIRGRRSISKTPRNLKQFVGTVNKTFNVKIC